MHVSLAHDVPGVAPAAAADWWSDFREGRTDHAFLPGTRRRILDRSDDHVEMVEETRWLGVPVFRERTLARREALAVTFEGENRFARFDGAYRFGATPDGARIRLEADVRLRAGLAWSESVARPVVLAILRVDLRGHANDMRRDLNVDRQNGMRT